MKLLTMMIDDSRDFIITVVKATHFFSGLSIDFKKVALLVTHVDRLDKGCII
jgi:hypothetical protein